MSQPYSEVASSVNHDGCGATSSTTGDCNPLVNTLKSQQRRSKVAFDIEGFVLHRRSVEVIRPFSVSSSSHVGGTRKSINAFSESSQRNLRKTCLNTTVDFKSQFCLTYHENIPFDGKESKKQLNTFLTYVRRKLCLKYIWVLEFQTKREVPHYHVFFNCEVTRKIHEILANRWNIITNETPSHLKFHLHHTNFKNWDFNRGGYLSKYLEKFNQKLVPDHFNNVGRFWGTSRGVVPSGKYLPIEYLHKGEEKYVETSTGQLVDKAKLNVIFMYRCLRKHQESKVRRIRKILNKTGKRYKSQIARITSCWLMDARTAFDQIDNYIRQNYSGVPF